MRFLSLVFVMAIFLVGAVTWLAGCRPQCHAIRETPTFWRTKSEIVQLHGPLVVAREYLQKFADSAEVSIAIIRPKSKSDLVRYQLLVFLDATSRYADQDIDLKCGKTYLQVGQAMAQSIAPSDCNDYSCGGNIKGIGPHSESGVFFTFDLIQWDSTALTTLPIMIRLDSILTFDKKVVDLGRIEMASFRSDTAEYIP